MANFQRNGSISNTHVGKEFEAKAKAFFAAQGINLDSNISIEIGIQGKKKAHKFDLGNLVDKIIVECKSHTWTETENIPSAKITTWDQAMYYFMQPQLVTKKYSLFSNITVKNINRLWQNITSKLMIIWFLPM